MRLVLNASSTTWTFTQPALSSCGDVRNPPWTPDCTWHLGRNETVIQGKEEKKIDRWLGLCVFDQTSAQADEAPIKRRKAQQKAAAAAATTTSGVRCPFDGGYTLVEDAHERRG